MAYRFRSANICWLKQSTENKPLVLFAAPATDINQWAGVPRKKRIGDSEETTGFQRSENSKRVQELRDFYSNPSNIVQNPLLCATRSFDGSSASFHPTPGSSDNPVQVGSLTISFPDYSQMSLGDLMGRLRKHLEDRISGSGSLKIDQGVVTKFKELARSQGHIQGTADGRAEEDLEEEEEADDDEGGQESESDDVSAGLYEETHIADFWHEVAARHEILKELGDAFTADEFLGFTRDVVVSFIQPVVLVDGQHRLSGALELVMPIICP